MLNRILPVLLLCLTLLMPAAACPADQALKSDTVAAWLATLSEAQQDEATAILATWEPILLELHNRLRQQLADLRNLRFDRSFSPETLPDLGRSLQQTRRDLNRAYADMWQQLVSTVGSAPFPRPKLLN